MGAVTGDVPYGTLDFMIMKTLEATGPMHGFGIARQIERVSRNLVELNQGSVYPALQRLRERGWITAAWGASETNRRAKFYSLTKAGRRQLGAEVASWKRTVVLMEHFLTLDPS